MSIPWKDSIACGECLNIILFLSFRFGGGGGTLGWVTRFRLIGRLWSAFIAQLPPFDGALETGLAGLYH